MARVYFDPTINHVPAGSRRNLPLDAIKRKLDDVRKQRLIPFLGAGASLPVSAGQTLQPPSIRPTAEQLQSICREFNITTANAKRFIEVALQFGQLLDSVPPEQAITPIVQQRAPSSSELAGELAALLNLEPYKTYADTLERLLDEQPKRSDYVDVVKRIARVMALHRSVPQLLTVASYFYNRNKLTSFLTDLFLNVKDRNLLHDKLALKAKQFVDIRNRKPSAVSDKTDYLFITTNYDSLIEEALIAAEVPTCVMTVDIPTCKVLVDFQGDTQGYLDLTNVEYADLKRQYIAESYRDMDAGNAADTSEFEQYSVVSNFQLPHKTHSLAMVYKLHGSLEIGNRWDFDNIVISDHDYVAFMQANGDTNQLIPSYVRTRLVEGRLLFLGYSFSDWNVRGLYRQFLAERITANNNERAELEPQDRDYVVMRSWEETDDLFFANWDVSVLVTALNAFAGAL